MNKPHSNHSWENTNLDQIIKHEPDSNFNLKNVTSEGGRSPLRNILVPPQR